MKLTVFKMNVLLINTSNMKNIISFNKTNLKQSFKHNNLITDSSEIL